MAGPDDDDPISSAESQMAEHELALFSRVFELSSRALGLPDDRELTEGEIRAAFKQLLSENPEALELANRLAVLQQFRES